MNIQGMKVLSVDDNLNNLLMIDAFARKLGLEVQSFNLPLEALEAVRKEKYDILIVDYMMPQINGVDFIRAFREFDDVSPIIMVTAVGDDMSVQLEALSSGANDFLSKPINFPTFTGRVKNLLKLKKYHKTIEERAVNLQSEVEMATETVVSREIESLRVLGKTAEYKDPETGSHILRVAGYAKAIAKVYGLSEKMQDVIYKAAPLHDIGKVGIPDKILLKPAKLDDNEWHIMKEHPLIGYEILKHSQSEYLKAGGIIAFTHHEKFDGTGYPKGLKGQAIPILGRIVALSDVFDALTTHRPYKEAWSFDQGVDYVIEEKGKHFDPEVVDSFIMCMDEIKEIYETYSEEEAYDFKL